MQNVNNDAVSVRVVFCFVLFVFCLLLFFVIVVVFVAWYRSITPISVFSHSQTSTVAPLKCENG